MSLYISQEPDINPLPLVCKSLIYSAALNIPSTGDITRVDLLPTSLSTFLTTEWSLKHLHLLLSTRTRYMSTALPTFNREWSMSEHFAHIAV